MKSKLSLIRALLAKIVEDIDTGNSAIDDDQYEEIAMTRWYADVIGKGLSISWEDML